MVLQKCAFNILKLKVEQRSNDILKADFNPPMCVGCIGVLYYRCIVFCVAQHECYFLLRGNDNPLH